MQVRFPLMDSGYLATIAVTALPVLCAAAASSSSSTLDSKTVSDVITEYRVWLEGLVGEATRAKCIPDHQRHMTELPRLGPKALIPRVRRGVSWGQYLVGGGRRMVAGHSKEVGALIACRGRVCSGSDDGTVVVWNPTTMERERTLSDVSAVAESGCEVWSLAAWEGWVLSGSAGGNIRVWDVGAGRCQQVIPAHEGSVNSLTVCGDRLLSASDDGSVGVWSLRTGWGPRDYRPRWGPVCEVGSPAGECERRLRGHQGRVLSVIGWGGEAASGSCDNSVRVWELSMGECVSTLEGHNAWVNALILVPTSRRLISSASDGGIRLWDIKNWECLRAVVSPGGDPVRCLTLSGPTVIGGVEPGPRSLDAGSNEDGVPQWKLIVWDSETLEFNCVIRGPLVGVQDGAAASAGAAVWQLLGVEGAVWGAVGRDLIVWGRD